MNYRKNEIKAGAFIVFCVLVLIAFLFAISGLECGAEKHHYTARFRYIGGISKGSLVRFGGMEIGRVADVRAPIVGDGRIELLLEVTEEAPIRTDSEAFLTTIGFMGAYYVEVTLGSPTAPLLPSGQRITSLDVTPFAQMAGPASRVTGRAEELLARLNSMLDEDNREAIGALVQGTRAMLAQENGDVAVLLHNLNTLSLELQRTVKAMNRVLESNEQALQEGIEEIPEVLGRTKDVLERLDQTIAHLDQMVVANSEGYADIVDGLQRATQNLEEFSRMIKERPWSLVRTSAPKERSLPK